jgi:anhydro-N-acetylmuramic acid kinase
MQSKPLFMLGIMSGTSADGIDVAIMRMETRPELLHFQSMPMPMRLREPILRLAEPGLNEIETMGALHVQLGRAYATAALQAIAAAGLKASDIAAIGCHGQTIRHRPAEKYPFTLQIGCASTIAEQTGITTVADFRSRDIAAGGQGAPLVPLAHRRLFGSDDADMAVLNIGGIANVTWLGKDGSIAGFDCGPGNMLMDSLMLILTDGCHAYDENGGLAASGKVCKPLLEKLLEIPFLHKAPPKSTGREEFGSAVVDTILGWPGISDADRLATACALSVESIATSRRFLPNPPQHWLVCGGGAYNTHLTHTLAARLAPADLKCTDALGMPGQAVEAACFAILAQQTLLGAANTIAEVTGATRPVCGGSITPGANWPSLLQDIATWIR